MTVAFADAAQSGGWRQQGIGVAAAIKGSGQHLRKALHAFLPVWREVADEGDMGRGHRLGRGIIAQRRKGLPRLGGRWVDWRGFVRPVLIAGVGATPF